MVSRAILTGAPILVLKDGVITEDGTHEELVAKGGECDARSPGCGFIEYIQSLSFGVPR